MKNHLRSLIFFLLAVLITGGLVVLFATWPRPAKDAEPSVAATIFPLYDIARNIVDDEVRVTLILPPGADAHAFEPSPSLLKNLQNTVVVYSIGHELDDWIESLADSIGVATQTVEQGINLRLSMDEHEGTYDPHYWLSAANAKIIASNIAGDLTARFPEHAPKFADNLRTYQDKLNALDTEIQTTLQDISNKNIVTFHDAWYYFADAYGLKVAGTFEPTAGREPTPQYLTELIEKVEEAGVKTIYYEPQMSVANLETFAKDYEINLIVLDDIGGSVPYDSYINLMKTNASTLKNNQ